VSVCGWVCATCRYLVGC